MDTLPDRPSGRAPDAMRAIQFDRGYTCHAEGSVLVSFGLTKVICTASVSAGVPGFLRGKGEGWLTAEFGMLARSTGSRMDREAARGKQGGRTVEIQRLRAISYPLHRCRCRLWTHWGSVALCDRIYLRIVFPSG